jgi:hypothetical protein
VRSPLSWPVELTLSTRDEEHCDELLGFLAEWGYEAERVR